MHHSNLSRMAIVADVASDLSERPLSTPGPRSGRTEMTLRELAKLQAQTARLAAIIEADNVEADEALSAEVRRSDAFVRGILQARLERSSFFPATLFSDPAWDMLLDLYAAELAQIRVSVTSLCIASNSPTSTALRWISALEGAGLIERQPDRLDGRRFFLSLTQQAVERFDRYFATIGSRTVI